MGFELQRSWLVPAGITNWEILNVQTYFFSSSCASHVTLNKKATPFLSGFVFSIDFLRFFFFSFCYLNSHSFLKFVNFLKLETMFKFMNFLNSWIFKIRECFSNPWFFVEFMNFFQIRELLFESTNISYKFVNFSKPTNFLQIREHYSSSWTFSNPWMFLKSRNFVQNPWTYPNSWTFPTP